MKFSVFTAILLVIIGLMNGCSTLPVQGKKYHPVTPDNWKLTLEHFPPAEGTVKKKHPVIIAHGLLANRRYFKINGENSIALMLSKQGYDVWLLDLRGRDEAGSPWWYLAEHTYNYSVDDYIMKDMDTALNYVIEKTGSKKVNWIGHSMGGMIAYARIGTLGDDRVANLVTVGSPVILPLANKNELMWYRISPGMAILPMVPTAEFSWWAFYLPLVSPDHIQEMLYYPENTDEEIQDLLMDECSNNISKPVARQFLASMKHGELVSKDQRVSYAQDLSKIDIPVFVIAGRRDHLADPSALREVYHRLASKDKDFFIAGKAMGLSDDYGHTDMLVGKKASEEVIPEIINWLNERNKTENSEGGTD